MRQLIPLLTVALVGCGGLTPPKNPDPVEVTGEVKLASGKKVSDVTLNLQPTESGGQATIPVKNGAFKGSVMPGKYTYYFTEGPKGSPPAAYQAIPEPYRSGAMDRQVEVKAGSALTLTLE